MEKIDYIKIKNPFDTYGGIQMWMYWEKKKQEQIMETVKNFIKVGENIAVRSIDGTPCAILRTTTNLETEEEKYYYQVIIGKSVAKKKIYKHEFDALKAINQVDWELITAFSLFIAENWENLKLNENDDTRGEIGGITQESDATE